MSALKRIDTDLRNKMKQLEMLMDIKLNGPEIEEFDFDYAVHLWLHGSRHRVVGSAVTTGIQREDAVRILRFPGR